MNFDKRNWKVKAQKSHDFLRERVSVKYAWIQEHRDSHPVALMCRMLQVSTSGFYRDGKAKPGPRAQRSERIREAVAAAYQSSNQVYGSHKVARVLQADATLESVCRNTVAKAMQDAGLKSRSSKHHSGHHTIRSQQAAGTEPAPIAVHCHGPEPKMGRRHHLPAHRRLVVYLAVVLDLFSRKVVGRDISESLATPLVSSALRQAIHARRPKPGELLHHSDRGCQYTSEDYQSTLRALGLTCSKSRTGCSYDNAVMERFFWSAKHEWTKFESFADIQDARLSIFRYIETFYNTERLHQSLGYLTPNQFEAQHESVLAA